MHFLKYLAACLIKKYGFPAALVLLFLPAAGTGTAATAQSRIIYRIVPGQYSPGALDSYPQKVTGREQKGDTCYLTVSILRAADDSVKIAIARQAVFVPGASYAPEIAEYLQPTRLINCRDAKIKNIADTLFGSERNYLRIIQKGLRFAAGYVSYDDSLALEISRGNCATLDVSVILNRKKGTCSEYTNLFTALMRAKGIPTRFITGFIYIPRNRFQGCHAWAECYVPGYGWLATDPQSGRLWIPPTAIKLFAGKDFEDLGIGSLTDMVPRQIEIVE